MICLLPFGESVFQVFQESVCVVVALNEPFILFQKIGAFSCFCGVFLIFKVILVVGLWWR